jgi:two-component system phosphate regulon sensor histidine kinase PhoR
MIRDPIRDRGEDSDSKYSRWRLAVDVLSVKVSLAIASVVFVVSLLGDMLFPAADVLVIGLLVLSTFAASHLLFRQIVSRRVHAARDTLQRLREHKFDLLEDIDVSDRDELDGLNKEIFQTGRQYEREIQDLKRVEEFRRKFVGNVSHELKTPIFSILGYSDTLLDGAIDDAEVRRGFVEKIAKNADRLQSLARDLTEISRLESGESEMKISTFDLREVLLEVVDSLESVASAHGVIMHVGASDNLPEALGNASRIRQVLVNLIDNAIKYTEEAGSITVTIREAPGQVLRVAVKDTGIGIAEEHLHRITERFFRVDQSRSRALGGTGLGLAIVKHILAAHKQTLQVRSKPGDGSTFSFLLPVADEEK